MNERRTERYARELEEADGEITSLRRQLQQALDAAGERESIASLVADREEMTVYLKVEAALKELESREAEIVQLRQEHDRLLNDWREQDSGLQRLLAESEADDEHVTDAETAIEAISAAIHELKAFRALSSRLRGLSQHWREQIEHNWREQSAAVSSQEIAVLGHRIDVRKRCADQLGQILLDGSPRSRQQEQEHKKEIDTR